MDMLHEGEFRLPDETMPVNDTIRKIIFTGTEEDEIEEIRKKYAPLGEIVFEGHDKEFEWDEDFDRDSVGV